MQQINLYKHLPQPVKSLLDARSLLVLYGVFCLMLMLSWLVSLMLKFHDNSKLNAAMAQYTASQHLLVQLSEKYPSSAVQLKAPDAAKIAYCHFKFSNYLETLGHVSVPGIWLSVILISDHGKSIVLKGHALVESQIQYYVDQLNKQKLLSNAPLILQDVTRNQADPNKPALSEILNFSLATKSGEAANE
jgi:hypothetical protein